jgi:medium-chain acyl-[acyl-carrier-protein] hydrolase
VAVSRVDRRLPARLACERVSLFCFPYAGAGSRVFGEWQRLLPPEIGVHPVVLPGREGRSAEPPHLHLPSLVDGLVETLAPQLGRQFALFGHSVGAILAFEFARAVRRRGLGEPIHLFVAASRPPQRVAEPPHFHGLPDAELIAELREMNPRDGSYLEDPELLRALLPRLRADFAVVETYEYVPEPRLSSPVSAYGALGDPDVTYVDLLGWQRVAGRHQGRFRRAHVRR